MALREILHYPDPRLRVVAEPVTEVNETIRTIIADMAETMYAAPGVGLAATQIDVHKRMIVIDISPEKNDLHVLINPVIIEKHGEISMEEGCLSVPGVFDEVLRAERVRVQTVNEQGESREFETDGLLAVCIQHEIDHLEGKIFVDYLSPLKQRRIGKKMLKHQRMAL